MTGIQKLSTVILILIAGLSLIFAGMYYLGGSYIYKEIYTAKNFTSLVLVWAVVLFLIAGIATLLFSLVNIFSSPKVLKGFLISLGLAVGLVLLSYLLASSAQLPDSIRPENINPTESTLKWVGTGLNATYILALVSFVGIIASEVIRAFK